MREFDLDAALARKPQLLLVDELAHTNPVGRRTRAAPRQALAGHRGAARRRHRRLHHGQRAAHREPERRRRRHHRRAHAGDGARPRVRGRRRGRADRHRRPTSCSSGCTRARSTCRSRRSTRIENFFRKGNLIALRELALRTTADRVDAAMREYREGHAHRRHLGGGRAPAGGGRPLRGCRAPGARRQAHGGGAARRVDRGLRRDAGTAAHAGGRARPAHRAAAPRRVAGRRAGDARRLLGRRGTRQLRAHPQRHAHPDRAAAALAVAAPVPPLHLRRAARADRGHRPAWWSAARTRPRRCAARSSRAAAPTCRRRASAASSAQGALAGLRLERAPRSSPARCSAWR